MNLIKHSCIQRSWWNSIISHRHCHHRTRSKIFHLVASRNFLRFFSWLNAPDPSRDNFRITLLSFLLALCKGRIRSGKEVGRRRKHGGVHNKNENLSKGLPQVRFTLCWWMGDVKDFIFLSTRIRAHHLCRYFLFHQRNIKKDGRW
jgi:hypothetical protein